MTSDEAFPEIDAIPVMKREGWTRKLFWRASIVCMRISEYFLECSRTIDTDFYFIGFMLCNFGIGFMVPRKRKDAN